MFEFGILNMEYKSKIQSFQDLNVWQEGHKLVLMVYKVTGTFPKTETYSLVDQMRRAVISVTSNIAEGFSRKSYKEKLQFYFMSQGSLTELENQLLIAKDVGYLKLTDYKDLVEQCLVVHKLLSGIIKSTRSVSLQ